MTSARSTCRCSTSRSRTGSASRRALCVHSETCGLALALEHTGDLYSCDHFVEPRLPARQHRASTACSTSSPRSSSAQFGLDKRDTLPAVLPRVRRALRLPRRLPQGPVHPHARRRAGAQLPLPGLQGVLPPRRRADAVHGRAAARGPRARRRSSPGTRPRTPGAAATTPAPAGRGASGSAAMAADGAAAPHLRSRRSPHETRVQQLRRMVDLGDELGRVGQRAPPERGPGIPRSRAQPARGRSRARGRLRLSPVLLAAGPQPRGRRGVRVARRRLDRAGAREGRHPRCGHLAPSGSSRAIRARHAGGCSASAST